MTLDPRKRTRAEGVWVFGLSPVAERISGITLFSCVIAPPQDDRAGPSVSSSDGHRGRQPENRTASSSVCTTTFPFRVKGGSI